MVKRKGIEDIWRGESFSAISDVVRFAPSACNTQPWLIEYDKNRLFLFKIRGNRGIMPQAKVSYYNSIDIGIMMCFLDICLEKEKLIFEKELYYDFSLGDGKELNAIYTLIHPTNLDSL